MLARFVPHSGRIRSQSRSPLHRQKPPARRLGFERLEERRLLATIDDHEDRSRWTTRSPARSANAGWLIAP
jgi:hypothetical protein